MSSNRSKDTKDDKYANKPGDSDDKLESEANDKRDHYSRKHHHHSESRHRNRSPRRSGISLNFMLFFN